MDVDNAIGALRQWSQASAEVLRPLPASVYTSVEFLDLEIEKLFNQEWVCVGHTSELQNAGDYLTFDIVNKPVLIVCDDNRRIRAFSNVCRHRAAVLAKDSGKRKRFTCPYHAWTYDLNGHLCGAPHMDAEQVKDICLPEYRVEIWQALVFVSLGDNTEPLAPQLEKLEQRIAPYDIARYQVVSRQAVEFSCNWKVLVENFCESYHVFRVHRKTLEPDSPTKSTKVLEGGDAFNHHTVDTRPGLFPEDAVSRLPNDLREVGHLICVYPCLAFSVDPTSAIWLSILPTGPQTLRCTAQIALFPNDGNIVTPDYAEAVRKSTSEFMAEDKATIELVQRGLAADVGDGGVLHQWERTNWEFGRYLVRQLLAEIR